MLLPFLKIFCRISLVALVVSIPARAQDQWSWPEKPQNLQVLDTNWTGARLRPVMMGFTRSLGVRCSYCHVGEEGKPLTTFNFVSDTNPNKDRAREMLRMLGSINEHLKKIEPSGSKRVNMWCHTCHHGRPKPMTLEEEIAEAYVMKGLDGALTHYRDLKKRFYGMGAYDFSEASLNNFGYELLGKKNAADAIRVFTLNTEEYPKSANGWDSLAEAYLKSGDTTTAQRHYEKSLELDPENKNAKEMLRKISRDSQK